MTENELAEKNAQFAKGVMELAFRMGYVTRDDELIRCKDCRYWQDNQSGHYPNELCPWDKGETPDEDDYCSFAERKEE